MGSYTYSWDSAVWDDGRWAKYQATWDNAVWDLSDWNFCWMGTLGDVIAQMEKYTGIHTVFETGCVEPGVDNFECPMREVIRGLEKQ